jgi:capsular polysaccharide biosynthesis protein
MDRLTKLASKFYPGWWRERYGEEFAALLEDARPGLGGTFDVLKGAVTMQLSASAPWKTVLVCASAGVVIGLATTFFMTPQYSSSAVIRITPPEGASQIDVVDTIKRYSNFVMDRVELSNAMRNLNLYPDERTKMPAEDILEVMHRNIGISAASIIVGGRSVPAFEIHFHYPDKVAAQKVVNRFVSGYIDENIRSRSNTQGLTMEVLDPASLPMDPIFPHREVFAVAGLGSGFLLGGLVALVLHFRRKRQTA